MTHTMSLKVVCQYATRNLRVAWALTMRMALNLGYMGLLGMKLLEPQDLKALTIDKHFEYGVGFSVHTNQHLGPARQIFTIEVVNLIFRE